MDTIKIGIITGITGQDGSYLTEFLLEKGYEVWGIIRRSSSINTRRIDHVYHHPRLFLRYGELTDQTSLHRVFQDLEMRHGKEGIERIEFYNLGAMSHVKVSFDEPEYCANTDGLGVLRCLETIMSSGFREKTRFYQASTSELYGKVQEVPQSETTPFYPRSPYGVAKLYGFWITKNYREAHQLYACNGILFNHESPRRGETFVTRKITLGLHQILTGKMDCLLLGNLDALRDWGHARDYVEGMWRILQQEEPDDFVLATNETHSVREFLEKAFALRNITLTWSGQGIHEVGIHQETGKTLVAIHPKYFRPAEVDLLHGDATKASRILDWRPQTTFDQLVQEMVDHDCPIHP